MIKESLVLFAVPGQNLDFKNSDRIQKFRTRNNPDWTKISTQKSQMQKSRLLLNSSAQYT